jgi:hypothetical protein
VADHHAVEIEVDKEDTVGGGKKSTLQKKGTMHKVAHTISWSTMKMNQFLKRSIQGETEWGEMNLL